MDGYCFVEPPDPEFFIVPYVVSYCIVALMMAEFSYKYWSICSDFIQTLMAINFVLYTGMVLWGLLLMLVLKDRDWRSYNWLLFIFWKEMANQSLLFYFLMFRLAKIEAQMKLLSTNLSEL